MAILYSTNCPKCRIREKELNKRKIEYELVTDKDLMMKKGFSSAPKLEIEGRILDFPDAFRWILGQGGQS